MQHSHSHRLPILPFRWLLSAIVLMATLASSAQAAPPFNSAEARKSVVFIKRITPGLGPSVGSGFLVSDDGLIYTNRHVAVPSDPGIKGTILLVGVPSAKDPDVLEYYRAETVYAPEKKEGLDFAVLKIEVRKGGPKFKPLPLSYDKLELGSDVAVLGYPHVQENQPNLSFNKGSVSSTRVQIEDRSYYQTDATINPGNSGGPLLNSSGNAVGIVTFKKGKASNIGFAVYLAEVKSAAELAQKQAVLVKPVPGPLDPRDLPVIAGIAPRKANWDVTAGTLREDKGALVLDNNGAPYWVTSKAPLPQDFQLVVPCQVEFLKGNQQLQASQKSILRTLCVRFDSADTKSMILERKGSLIQFSHELLLLYKEGERDAVKVEQKGNSEESFVLVITKLGGDYTVAVDGEVLLKFHDDKPLKGGHNFCLGGYLSRLYFGEVSVMKLEAPPKVGGEMPPSPKGIPADKATVAKTSEALVGKWSVRVGPEFQSEWTFVADGTVTSTKGESKGTWRIDDKDGTPKVLVEWPKAKAWEKLSLPLDPNKATEISSAGPGHTIEAIKLKDQPNTPEKSDPMTTAVASEFDKTPLFDLSKGAGLPSYLMKPSPTMLGDPSGLRGGEARVTVPDVGSKDYTFDVLFEFNDTEKSIAVIGATSAGPASRAIDASVCSRIHSPGYGGYATFSITGKQEGRVGEKPFKTAGPHMYRIVKKGDSLTLSIGEWKDSKFSPYGANTIAISKDAPMLAKAGGVPFFGGDATFLGVRLAVDGKTVDPGKPAPPPADLSKIPLTPLGGARPLPPYLVTDKAGVADKDGLSLNNAAYHLKATELLDKDFVLDLQFRFQEKESSIIVIGLAGEKGHRVCSRVHGPGFGGYATFSIEGIAESRLATFKTAGPYLFRLEKRGQTLTLGVGEEKDGAFVPIATKTIPRLAAVAPFLTLQECTPIVLSGSGGKLEAVRFVVNGETTGANVAVVPKVGTDPKTPTEPKTPAGAAVSGIEGREHLIRLTGAPLPTYLSEQPGLKFETAGGLVLSDRIIRTSLPDFATKDFTFDVVFRFKEREGAIALVGLGAAAPRPGGGIDLKESVCSRLHGPGHGGYGTVTVSGLAERRLGDYKTAGPHMFRLQKKGNVLTMAVCIGFKDKFTADIVQSIPDLKATAPFLTKSNSWLFMGAGGVVESVRLVVDGEPIETRDLTLNLPTRVIAGRPLKQPLLAAPENKKFAVATGPKGFAVSADGTATWAPAAEQLGRHEVRINVTGPKETTQTVLAIEAVSAEDAAAVGGNLSKIDSLYQLPLASGSAHIVPGFDRKSLLVVEGDKLRRVTGGGIVVKEELTLPARYERLFEREDYFVGLSDEKKALHVIDKKTMKVRRSIKMDYQARTDLAPHPTKAVCYVCVVTGGEGPPARILIVEEDTGDVLEPAGLYGSWAVVSPDGRELYAGYREIYQKGARLLINPDRVHVVPEYGTFDALMVYDITRDKPVLRRLKEEPGGNGSGIVLSPDGKRLTYLSYTGYPVFSGEIPAWPSGSFDKRPIGYSTKDVQGLTLWIAYHPVLEIAAVPTKGGVVCYDRETGEVQPKRADLTYPPLGDVRVHRVFFSPDGRHLLLECEGGGVRSLRRVRLNLTPAEVAKLTK